MRPIYAVLCIAHWTWIIDSPSHELDIRIRILKCIVLLNMIKYFQVTGLRKLVHVHEEGLHFVQDLSGTKASSITDGVLYTITQTRRVRH